MKKKTKKFGNKVAGNSKKQAQEGSQYGYMNLPKGVGLFQEEPGGRAFMDIMPYLVSSDRHMDRDTTLEIATPGELWYKHPFKIHRQVGVNKDTEPCPTSFGMRCPICNYRAQRAKEGAPTDELKTYNTSLRNLYVVIPKDMEKYEEKPYIWNISQAMFQEMLNEEVNENENLGIFPDLEEGLSLRIRFKSSTIGKSKPFAEASRIDFEERDQPYDESILKKIPDLDKVIRVKPYDELERIFFELGDAGSESSEKPEDVPKEEAPFNDGDCVACGGTGTNSKGRECVPCGGTGKQGGKEEAPTRTEPPKKDPEPKEDSSDSCPYGHKFGKDCEEFEECDDCDKWDVCINAKENG